MTPIEKAIKALETAKAELMTAEQLAISSGFWTNDAGYTTDAALWIKLAQGTIAQALSDLSSVRLEGGDVETLAQRLLEERRGPDDGDLDEHDLWIDRVLSALGHGGADDE